MIKEDDLNSKEDRDVFNRLLSEAVLAGKPLEEYLKDLPLSDEEKKSILEYRKNLKEKENPTGETKQVIESVREGPMGIIGVMGIFPPLGKRVIFKNK